MPVVNAGGRRLATVETIAALSPIPGADRIVSATVRGWNVVVGAGEFSAGDPVVFFEIDTALPTADARFAFLAARGEQLDPVSGGKVHVLRTMRLRGVYSQGLVLPLSAFDLPGARPGDDVTGRLGLGKWEPALPTGGGAQIGPFDTALARVTDSERIQNLADAWAGIIAHRWRATEKIDGSSLTAALGADGRLRVFSRNWEVSPETGLWSAAATTTGLARALTPGITVQAEIAGPGIQGNRLGLARLGVFVFDVWDTTGPRPGVLARDAWPGWCADHAVPDLGLELPATIEAAIGQADGLRSRVAPGRLAEGIVWHTADASEPAGLGRSTFKVISNRYLAKAAS